MTSMKRYYGMALVFSCIIFIEALVFAQDAQPVQPTISTPLEDSGSRIVTAPSPLVDALGPWGVFFTSAGGIVALNILIIGGIKKWGPNWPVVNQIPYWVQAIIISCVLTYIAHQFLGTLEGQFLPLLIEAIRRALEAAGIISIKNDVGARPATHIKGK